MGRQPKKKATQRIKTQQAQKTKNLVEQLSKVQESRQKVTENAESNISLQKQEKKPVLKVNKPKDQEYVWQDFITIYNFTKDQALKLNCLLPKGACFIAKGSIPQSVKVTHTHTARKLNLAREYDHKQAQRLVEVAKEAQEMKSRTQQEEQIIKKTRLQPQSGQSKAYYFQPEQESSGKNLSSQKAKQDSKIPLETNSEKSKKKSEQAGEQGDSINLHFKQGQQLQEDMSIFQHPVYQNLRNVVIFRELIDPKEFQNNKNKQIRKQLEQYKTKRIKEERMKRLNKLTVNNHTFSSEALQTRVKWIKRQKEKKKRDLRRKKKLPKAKNLKAKMFAMENPKIALELVAIKEIMEKLQKHELYPILLQATTFPSTKFLLKLLRAKIKKYFKITQFQSDIKRIFRVFQTRSKEKTHIIRNIKNYQKTIQSAINAQKRTFASEEAKAPERIRLSETLTETQSVLSQSRTRGIKGQIPTNIGLNKFKAVEKSQLRILKEYQTRQLQKLGKNILSLGQKEKQQFCVSFCLPNSQQAQGESYTFQFDLNKQSKQRLAEMEMFVKEKLMLSERQYVDLSESDLSEEFVIDDDD